MNGIPESNSVMTGPRFFYGVKSNGSSKFIALGAFVGAGLNDTASPTLNDL